MKSIEVKGTARTIAERSSEQARALKEIRKNGGVPCVLYGGNEVVHFTVTNEGLRNLVYTPHIYVVDLVKGRMRTLSICGKKYSSIPSKRADGEEVSTITGFCSLNESGCPS